MKILLDESIDIHFKKSFPPQHEVCTVKDMNWTGIKNGKLIELLAENNFDYWIIVDKNIPYQQNIENIPFIIIVLGVFRNTLKQRELLLPKIMKIVRERSQKKLIILNQDGFFLPYGIHPYNSHLKYYQAGASLHRLFFNFPPRLTFISFKNNFGILNP